MSQPMSRGDKVIMFSLGFALVVWLTGHLVVQSGGVEVLAYALGLAGVFVGFLLP